MTIRELSEKLRNGNITCAELTGACLRAIAGDDSSGRRLNSVAEIAPDALFQARAIDAEIAAGDYKGPLHGIPVLLKDNIDVKGLHTTAGSAALEDLIAQEDAFITKKLKEAGALILGKANLSEFAYWMSRNGMPSGYSSRCGQVVHAYVPGTDPSGSSSGSAVAVSARFVPYSIGTETDGSLMSPAAANAIVSIKPTVGLVSRAGILPLSPVQDTAGPMCTSVEDAAIVLAAICGKDENDAATFNCRTSDYPACMKEGVKWMRIGIFSADGENSYAEYIAAAKDILGSCGAEVIEARPEELMLNEESCLTHEFKQSLNSYLSSHSSRMKSLKDIIEFNLSDPDRCLRYGQDLLTASEAVSGRLTESEYIEARLELDRRSHELLDGMMEKAGIDCLLSAGRGPVSNLAPISGDPCMSIPAAAPDEKDFRPCSYYMMAGAYREDILFRVAYTLEQALQLECRPSWTKDMV